MFNVTLVAMDHQGGTKRYSLLMVENKDSGAAICVKRWGKTGTWGQLEVVKGDVSTCQKAFESKLREKRGGGYEVKTNDAKTHVDKETMLSAIGPYRHKLDKSVLGYITGDSSVDNPWDETPAPDFDSDEPVKSATSGTASHPEWGSW